MDVRVRPVRRTDSSDVVRLSLSAWEPVFASLRKALGPRLFAKLQPDWRKSQSEAVASLCRGDGRDIVWVAEIAGVVVGFVAYVLDEESRTGKITYLAVDPAYQQRGVGTKLSHLALDRMREAGMEIAQVETGGDPGHAPARRSYEKAGFTALPIARCFQVLR